MTIEEKAKAYDEAFKEAEKIHNFSSDIAEIKRMEQIFPELSDNKDELIKNRIIKLIKMSSEVGGFALHKWEADEMLAWLKKQGQQKCLDDVAKEVTKNKETAMSFLKSCGIMNANGELADKYKIEQGEQKPANKVEAKFHEGDWVVNNNSGGVCQVTEIRDDEYCLWPLDDEIKGYLRIIDVDNDYHLWTIQDAKPGDVIYLPNSNNGYYFFIFKGIENATVMSFAHFYQYNDGTSEVKGTIDRLSSVNGVFQPATKEQRDLLFQKMHEAGYMWDSESKQLLSLKAEPSAKQKPTWGEDDEDMIQALNACIDTAIKSGMNYISFDSKSILIGKVKNWFKSIKDRVQHKQELSEEDNKWIKNLIQTFEDGYFEGFNQLKSYGVIDWLKSMKDRVLQKQEWSEEDEDILNFVTARLHSHPNIKFDEYSKEYNWLKSIKQRIGG